MISLLLSAVMLPAAAEEEQRNILVSEEYRILRDGEVLEFKEGYETILKGFGPDSVLVEIFNNFSDSYSVGSAVLREGETIQCYRTLENESIVILIMTLDKLYINNSQVVAGFSHIYQYEDENTRYSEETKWFLETAVLEDPSVPNILADSIKIDNVEDVSEPTYIILIITFAAAAMIIIGLLFRKRVENGKIERSKKKK
ncbi:hypothetical protein [Methanimicrococcus hongohii]|uniref:hypothetical protein n=1 Tax=Methanimicrococcus hongohii TaxID=3028295 RepID=UPI00292D8B90|nr:hypothetical protein [Methanimicrococcus sp. Hf6]